MNYSLIFIIDLFQFSFYNFNCHQENVLFVVKHSLYLIIIHYEYFMQKAILNLLDFRNTIFTGLFATLHLLLNFWISNTWHIIPIHFKIISMILYFLSTLPYNPLLTHVSITRFMYKVYWELNQSEIL